LAVTVITVEEQLTGWYTQLRRVRQPDQLARVYRYLADTVTFLGGLNILSFVEPAILRYEQLKAMRLGVAGNDLRIAAIALEFGGIVVTRNVRDFSRVPNLSVENWTV
jgi:tRNA(fMet)-specific endonuclease VapC